MRTGTFILLWLLLIPACTSAQASKTKQEYQGVIRDFYKLLFAKKPVTIAESRGIFGSEAELWEESLFMDSCKREKSEKICDRALIDWFSKGDKSLFFIEIARKRVALGKEGLVEKAIMEMKFRKSNIVELTFSDEVVIFFFDTAGSGLYVTSIFLPGGASIFNHMGGSEVYYK